MSLGPFYYANFRRQGLRKKNVQKEMKTSLLLRFEFEVAIQLLQYKSCIEIFQVTLMISS